MTQLEKSLLEYIKLEATLFIEEETREAALLAMTRHLLHLGYLQEENHYYEAILEREHIVSTGIGRNIALPHAKIEGISEFFIAIGVVLHEGIDWDAIDSLRVRLIFLIGGPQKEHKEYLKLLSKLTEILKNEEIRGELLLAKEREDVAKIFETWYTEKTS